MSLTLIALVGICLLIVIGLWVFLDRSLQHNFSPERRRPHSPFPPVQRDDAATLPPTKKEDIDHETHL